MSAPPSPSSSSGSGAGLASAGAPPPPAVDSGDDFVRAVLLAMDPTTLSAAPVATQAQLKQQAEQYCQQIKSSSDGWKVCLQKLHQMAASGGPEQVKFFCLDVIAHVVQTRYDSMSEDDRRLIRNGLMVFVRDIIPRVQQPPFIKNKLSTVLVMIVKSDYPERWPSFFHDFLSLLDAGGIQVIDVFLRVLKIIDEDVVTPDEQRAKQEQLKNTQIKDTMKDTCLKSIIEAMHGILLKYHSSHPPLASLCLSAMAHYIDWIDINLIANDTMIPLFYQFLGDTRLQNESCECLIEVVDKRMQDRPKKVALIKQLRIIDVVTTISKSEVSQEFATNLAKLVDSIGTELIECLQKIHVRAFTPSSSPHSGVSLTHDQLNGVHALLSEINAMIEQTMQLAYQ